MTGAKSETVHGLGGVHSLDFSGENFIAAPENSWLSASVMPVVHIRGSLIRSVGTCFAISNSGLCITARHVIEDAWVSALSEVRQPTDDDGSICALYSSPVQSGEQSGHFLGGLLPINKVHINDSIDIALIHVNLPTHATTDQPLPLPVHQLGLAPPNVGEMCMAIGYHAASWSSDDLNLIIDHRMSASRGTVEEKYIPHRDTVVAPFPCFRTSARYDGGMSGGPVITEDGLVRGVVCSSFSLGDDAGHTSLASMVGAATLIRLEGKRGEIEKPEPLFLWDFIEGGAVKAHSNGFRANRLETELKVQFGGFTFTNALSP